MAVFQVRRVLTALVVIAAVIVGCADDAGDGDNGPGEDVNGPKIVSTSPAEDETWPPDQPLQVVFDEDVTAVSVLEGISIIGVAVSVDYDDATRTATVTPQEELPSGAAFTLSVRRVKDLAGNSMLNVVTVNFRVE